MCAPHAMNMVAKAAWAACEYPLNLHLSTLSGSRDVKGVEDLGMMGIGTGDHSETICAAI